MQMDTHEGKEQWSEVHLIIDEFYIKTINFDRFCEKNSPGGAGKSP